MKKHILSLLVAVGLIGSASAAIDNWTFGNGANQFSIDFTTIGNAGNAADPLTGYGSVGYSYAIGTYDISQNQLQAAENASGQNFGLVGAGGWSGDQPAGFLNWYQAAAFVNWLNTSTGHQAAYDLTYSGGAYTMSLWHSGPAGYDPNNPYRNSLALYVLPSENEFYKAAYGLNDASGYTIYADGSNTAPVAVASGTAEGTAVYGNDSNSLPASVYLAGGHSSYGTVGQEGNAFQWLESSSDGSNTDPTARRVVRGGDWRFPLSYLEDSTRNSLYPSNANNYPIGFRVAQISANAVPEPSTFALFGLGAVGLLMVIRRKKTA
jgi:hypothetical protein